MTRKQQRVFSIVALTALGFVLISAIHFTLGNNTYSSVNTTIDGHSIYFKVPQSLVDQMVFTPLILLIVLLLKTRAVNIFASTVITSVGAFLLAGGYWLTHVLAPADLMSGFVRFGRHLHDGLLMISIVLAIGIFVVSVGFTLFRLGVLELPSGPSQRS